MLRLFLLVFRGVRCVQITDLRVPSLVRNGSASHALLDCEYSLSQEESGPNSGLVVKWFFNDSPSPVYQWIPGKHPQDLDILKGRLNLDYKASNHKSTMHRALYINNPTTELSGNYKCVVSTFDDEDFMNKKMTVFASPSRFEILQSRHDADTINITCVASGVFPEPKVFLWKHPDAALRIKTFGSPTVNLCTILKDSQTEIITKSLKFLQYSKILKQFKVHAYTETAFRNGAYDITASVSVVETEFSGPITFSCDLKIAAISKNFTVKTTFRPDKLMARELPGE
ncbi:hypothetical protein M8J75_008424 [Diaphorina citri]|nr:hypothetical protein M8J75_008424 [Diaphorina citri]